MGKMIEPKKADRDITEWMNGILQETNDNISF